MAETLANQGHEVIFVDNASTYEPLVSWYEEQGDFQVIRLPNLGARAPWRAGLVTTLEQPYVVTDPDLDISGVPEDWPQRLYDGLYTYDTLKVGLSLDESRVPQENPAYELDKMGKFPNNTGPRWTKPLSGGFWDAAIDTTFAMYRPLREFRIAGIRTDRPYIAQHLPWHITLSGSADTGKLSIPYDDEIEYYFTHVETSSMTVFRMLEMTKQYQQQKAK